MEEEREEEGEVGVGDEVEEVLEEMGLEEEVGLREEKVVVGDEVKEVLEEAGIGRGEM